MNNLTFKIDFRSGVPIYLQIVEQVKTLLLEGELKPDDQLPTVRQLASDLRVNFNTVARAYRILDEAGMISTQQGRGTYLIDTSQTEVVTYINRQTIEGLVENLLTEAKKMGYTQQDILNELHNKTKQNYPDPNTGIRKEKE